MIIEYLPVIGNLQLKIGNHRKVLNDLIIDPERGDTAKSNTTNEPRFVREVFNAVMAIPETRTTTLYKSLEFNTGFDSKCPILKIDSTVTALLDDFSGMALELRTFIDAIKAYSQTNGKGLFVELCELEDLKDEEDTIETVLQSQDVIKLIDGKYTETTENVPVQITDPMPIFKDGVDTGRTIDIPRVKKGKKVPQKKKDRLRALRAIRDNL